MNIPNFTGVRIKLNDFQRLPPHMRKFTDGPMVMSHVNGKGTFVRAIIID